jgi:hypothetical protein
MASIPSGNECDPLTASQIKEFAIPLCYVHTAPSNTAFCFFFENKAIVYNFF